MPSDTKNCGDMLVILGPTASGKTRLAVTLANELDGEIISADSRQVFRGMDIGSGKDLHEYGKLPYHLIDILDAGDEFSVFDFQRKFFRAYSDISLRGKLPILCGGSGLYLDAILRGYKMIEVPINKELRAELSLYSNAELVDKLYSLRPDQHNSTDLLDRERTIRAIEIACCEPDGSCNYEQLPHINTTVIGILWEREALRQRITARLKERLENGMIEEVERLHADGIPWERLNYYGLEYRFVGAYLQGELTKNDMYQRLNSAIHNFAKRQWNWFRRMERNGININWIEGSLDPLTQAREVLQKSYNR